MEAVEGEEEEEIDAGTSTSTTLSTIEATATRGRRRRIDGGKNPRDVMFFSFRWSLLVQNEIDSFVPVGNLNRVSQTHFEINYFVTVDFMRNSRK